MRGPASWSSSGCDQKGSLPSSPPLAGKGRVPKASAHGARNQPDPKPNSTTQRGRGEEVARSDSVSPGAHARGRETGAKGGGLALLPGGHPRMGAREAARRQRKGAVSSFMSAMEKIGPASAFDRYFDH